MAFKKDMEKHLEDYKVNRLGVVANGEWENRKYKHMQKYSHILPVDYRDLNLLEPYRIDLANHIEEEHIKRHQGFHHLTSSQAVCLNFFIRS